MYLCCNYHVLWHKQQIMTLFWMLVVLCLNMEMTDHCILYISFNEQIIYEWVIFLSAETTMIDGEFIVPIYTLTRYSAWVTKAYSSKFSIWNIVLGYCGNTCSTSSLLRFSSHFSWLCWYWSEIKGQVEPLFVDLVSIPPYTSWHICSTSSNLYKVPCL